MTTQTCYEFVRDRKSWDATLVALDRDADGNLTLARLPGPSDGAGVTLLQPYDIGSSGIAAGPCGATFLSITSDDRIIFLDTLCSTAAELRSFDHPCGLAVGSDSLWVADSSNSRVRRLAFPTLEPTMELLELQNPTGVGCDVLDRIYVLDRGLQSVRRYSSFGKLDVAFNETLAASGTISAPLYLALSPGGELFVSDGAANTVYCFDAKGGVMQSLPTPTTGWRPGAIAVAEQRIFVSDRGAGCIQIFNGDGSWWGVLPNFQGPVTALSIDGATGDLLIKTGLDEAYVRFKSDVCFASMGQIYCGPFDAGNGLEWFRAACAADVPVSTALVFEVAQSPAPSPGPAPSDWVATPLDTLLAEAVPSGATSDTRRFIWMRATLTTRNVTATPTVRQIRAETKGEDYRDYLPEIYSRQDEPSEFLFRLLALTRSELGAVEENIDALPQLLSPRFVPSSQLPWLAAWLGLDLPRIATDTEQRSLIENAVKLWARRGTPTGLADLVEIYTGVRPSIVEAFSQRGLWMLDESCRLGFDTGLPAIDPNGMVVPDPSNPLALGGPCGSTAIGSSVVGESGPLPVQSLGEPLFADAAFRFTAFLPSYRVDNPALLAEARRVIEAEKPAYTGYDLCIVCPDLRVGFQSMVGVDTIVGGPPDPLRLDKSLLGLQGTLPPPVGDATRVGQGARVDDFTTVLR